MRSTPNAQPVGVVILVALGAIFGIYSLMGGLAVFGFGAFVTASVGFFGTVFSLIGFLILVVGILEIIAAYGAWLLRGWSWTLGVVVAIASVVINTLWVATGASFGSGLIGVLAALAILYCLDSQPVRSALGRTSTSLLTARTRRPIHDPTRTRRS